MSWSHTKFRQGDGDRQPLHCCAAIRNCDFFELLYPVEGFAFGLKETLPIENGMARAPARPGLGVDLDWDEIDRCTVKIV